MIRVLSRTAFAIGSAAAVAVAVPAARADDVGVGFFGGGHDHTGFVALEVGGHLHRPHVRMPRIHWPRVSFDVTAYPAPSSPYPAGALPEPGPSAPMGLPYPMPFPADSAGGPYPSSPPVGDLSACREWIPAHDVAREETVCDPAVYADRVVPVFQTVC